MGDELDDGRAGRVVELTDSADVVSISGADARSDGDVMGDVFQSVATSDEVATGVALVVGGELLCVDLPQQMAVQVLEWHGANEVVDEADVRVECVGEVFGV